MTSLTATVTRPHELTGSMPAPGPGRFLIINDDAALRLRLAELLGPKCVGASIDTCTREGAKALGAKLKEYHAAIAIIDFGPQGAADPVHLIPELRAIARALSVIVVGSQGSERSAVRALRAGAIDYWPLHSVDPAELAAVLQAAAAGEHRRSSARAGSVSLTLPGFRVLKELSRSPRAVLYLAESVELAEHVALKVHRHSDANAASREERERFTRECRLLGQVNHRGVADMYDFGVTDEFHWLAMEYFPCGSLKSRMQHPLSEAEVLNYVTQLGNALAAVHAAGIVHRDLKPSNIMLRADDAIALIDFGLARPALALSSVTNPNVRVGSPYYMAPEQIQGLPPDARCDLYALGILFHEMLTGKLPFAGQTVAEVLDQHRKSRPPRLPGALSRYQAVLDRLLAKRPTERLASAEAFLGALGAARSSTANRSATP